jgi:stress-induced morphogen
MSSASTQPDQAVDQIRQALAAYQNAHPRSQIEIKRQNNVSIRIRIIDPDFAARSLHQREDAVWEILNSLPGEVRSDITMVLLLTPEEQNDSLASQDFDHPVPSRL